MYARRPSLRYIGARSTCVLAIPMWIKKGRAKGSTLWSATSSALTVVSHFLPNTVSMSTRDETTRWLRPRVSRRVAACRCNGGPRTRAMSRFAVRRCHVEKGPRADHRPPRTAAKMRPNGGAEWRAATPSTRFTPAHPRCDFPARWGHSAAPPNARIGSGHCADATNERVSARGARRAAPRRAAPRRWPTVVPLGPVQGRQGGPFLGGCRFGEL